MATSISYVGMVIVCRAEHLEKVKSNIAAREVGRNTLINFELANIMKISSYHKPNNLTLSCFLLHIYIQRKVSGSFKIYKKDFEKTN